MNKVGFGILSTAKIAKKIIRAVKLFTSDEVEIVAVGSRCLERSKAFISEVGLPSSTKAYGSYQEVLDDPAVCAVYIPLPSSLHLEWLTRAMQAGKHVLMEKPVCRDRGELSQLQALLSSHPGLVFMDGTMWLHTPRRAVLQEVIRGGALGGPVRHMFGTFCFNLLGRGTDDIRLHKDLDSLGCLGDLGWYCVGAALWAMDYSRPDHALAHPGGVYNEEGVPITLGATIVWADGRRADFTCGFHCSLIQDFQLVGETGVVRMSDAIIPHWESHADFEVHQGAKVLRTQQVSTPEPQEASMLRDFADLVRRAAAGECPAACSAPGLPLTWPEISLLTQTVVCAIMESAQSDCKPVKV